MPESTDPLSSRAWYEALARLHRHVGDEDFNQLLATTVQTITPYEHAVIIGYPQGERPFHCYDDLPSEQLDATLKRYFQGAYLLDPFFTACHGDEPKRGVFKLRQLAPDEFYSSEYYRTYYAGTRLTEEVGLFLEIASDVVIVVSLGVRSRQAQLTAEDLTRLDTVFPLLQSLYQPHAQQADVRDSRRTEDKGSTFGESLELAFQNFGREVLSTREAEIVRLILRGHSSRSISEQLHISADTVKAHRKHIHSKLNISSQAELFSLFLDALAVLPINSVADPLQVLIEGD